MDSAGAAEHHSLLRFGEFILCRQRHCLCRNKEQIHLRGKVFKTLVFLLENRGRTLSREALLQSVWADTAVIPNTVDHAIAELRHALNDNDAKPRFIETVAREGYCFIAEVEELPGDPLPCVSRESLAVLPFLTLGLGPEEEWLGEGMADALITRLSKHPEFSICPTGAVLKYTDGAKSPLVAGRELRVKVILEGMIQRSGKQIRVSVQLLRVADGNSLWAETYDEKFQDIFSLEDIICKRVMQTLVRRLGSDLTSLQ
ncbi:MAG: winged helix-turn-helix domain-containing protein [Terriglobia bacterium]